MRGKEGLETVLAMIVDRGGPVVDGTKHVVKRTQEATLAAVKAAQTRYDMWNHTPKSGEIPEIRLRRLIEGEISEFEINAYREKETADLFTASQNATNGWGGPSHVAATVFSGEIEALNMLSTEEIKKRMQSDAIPQLVALNRSSK